MAKGIAGGFPVGATITTDEIAASWKGKTISTFGGNPICMAAMCATLDVMKEERGLGARRGAGRAAARGPGRAAGRTHPWIGDVRGMGLMQAMEIVEDPAGKEPDGKRTSALLEACREEGLLLGQGGMWGHCVRIGPSLLVTEERDRRGAGEARARVRAGRLTAVGATAGSTTSTRTKHMGTTGRRADVRRCALIRLLLTALSAACGGRAAPAGRPRPPAGRVRPRRAGTAAEQEGPKPYRTVVPASREERQRPLRGAPRRRQAPLRDPGLAPRPGHAPHLPHRGGAVGHGGLPLGGDERQRAARALGARARTASCCAVRVRAPWPTRSSRSGARWRRTTSRRCWPSFPVQAIGPDSASTVVDVTDFYKGDTPAISGLSPGAAPRVPGAAARPGAQLHRVRAAAIRST